MTEAPYDYAMRSRCRYCGGSVGVLQKRGGQNCIFCKACGRLAYNAPRVETGEEQRSVTTVHNGVKPRQRLRILERATGRCELCGSQGPLHIDHLLPVKDGLEAGLTEVELNSDENLAALCEECNLGKGRLLVSARTYIAILLRRQEAE